jgi:dihydrofolate synthase / folylpolyglutamate synthase
MKYHEALKYLYDQLPMYQRVGPAAYKNSLDNTLALDAMFAFPHRRFKAIHVAGTNGKGSVSHTLAAVLQCAGYKVGLCTSPHLKDYRERIKVNGEMIKEEAVCDFLERFFTLNQTDGVEPSFFELSVIMAFDYFAKCDVDFAVIEVGLGGRLDSTNVITPLLSVITNISFDHTNLLGNTIEAIAAEKAGIIKRGVPVVIGEHQPLSVPVFEQKANEQGAALHFADNDYRLVKNGNTEMLVTDQNGTNILTLTPDLKGDYQQKNLLTAVASVELLRKQGVHISDTQLADGVANVIKLTGLLGRWQIIGQQPTIVCDTAHNEAGIAWVVKQLEKQPCRLLHIVFGVVNDKPAINVLKLLPKKARYYFTQAAINRAYNAELLLADAVKCGLNGNAYSSVADAVVEAKINAAFDDFIFIGGSTFVVAEAL